MPKIRMMYVPMTTRSRAELAGKKYLFASTTRGLSQETRTCQRLGTNDNR